MQRYVYRGIDTSRPPEEVRAQLAAIAATDRRRFQQIATGAAVTLGIGGGAPDTTSGLGLLYQQCQLIEKERQAVLDAFQKQAMAVLVDICDTSSQILRDEQARYGLAAPSPTGHQTAEASELLSSVRELIDKRNTAQTLGDEATYEREGFGVDAAGDYAPEAGAEAGAEAEGESAAGPSAGDAAARAAEAQRDLETYLARSVARYPVLRGLTDDAHAGDLEGVGAASRGDATAALAAIVSGNLGKIADLKAKAQRGAVKVWDVPELVKLTKERVGLASAPGGACVDQHLEEFQRTETIKTLVISAFSLALGIIGFLPSGGMSVAAAGSVVTARVGATAISVYMLADDMTVYLQAQELAAAGLGEAPSLFWMLVNAGFTLGDLHGLRGITGILMPAYKAMKSRQGVEAALRALPAGPEGAQILNKAITEMGIVQTATAMNKEVKELAAIAEAAGDAGLAARIAAAAAKPLTLDEVADTVRRLPSASPAEVARLGEEMAKVIDLHGALPVLRRAGGWKALVKALGDESPASKRLLAWRDEVVGPAMIEYANTLPRGANDPAGVVRGGTKGRASNDFDWSTLGPHASANRDAIAQFLEQRFGIGRTEFGPLLDAELFTDPRRMFLYDQLEPELRAEMERTQMEFSEKLLYNRMLDQAKKHNAPEAVQKDLVAQMEKRGIYDPGYVEMTPGDIQKLNADIDKWHQQLQEATDYSEKKRLVNAIGQAQGQINAVQKGGYLSPGGVKGFSDYDALPLAPLSATERYTAALDQLLKFRAAHAEFDELTADIVAACARGDIADAIKKLAKYGERFSRIVDTSLFSPVPDLGATVRRLMDVFEVGWSSAGIRDLLAEARSGAVLKKLHTDPSPVIDDVKAEVGKLMDRHEEVLTMMRVEAGILDAAKDPTLLLDIQRATILRVRMARAWELLHPNLDRLAKAVSVAYGAAANEPPAEAAAGGSSAP